MIETITGFVTQHPVETGAIASSVIAIVTTGIQGFLRRPKKTSQGGAFLENEDLLKPPMARPAYSDRMAYVMAELSALAYFKFEGSGDGALQIALDKFRQMAGGDSPLSEYADKVLKEFRDDLLVKSIDSREILQKILEKADFKLLGTLHVGDTQGFVCKRNKQGEASFVVVAFRGTEQVLADWLTDVNAKPVEELLKKEIKMHHGFWDALNKKAKPGGKNVLEEVKAILDSSDAKNGSEPLPCYFTGHSLGGALALIATCELAPTDVIGACYTFGAPRVASYEYFRNIKTPVYRVVNSSDIVPRVPPGAIMGMVLKLVQGSKWLTQFIPGLSKILDWLEVKVDQLNGYRHHGDQRYLTDVKSGRFDTVHLLSNPPAVDRIWWMWQHIRKSLKEPVKSHGMAIYRSKLEYIARHRNPG